MLQTKKANPNKPYRIMIYGLEGTGKSTFGAKAEKPLFLSPEGGADQLRDAEGSPVEELPNVKNWEDLKSSLQKVLKEEHDFKTLVLDSADWIESLCQMAIVGTSGKTMTTVDGGYGSGFKKAQTMHKELLDVISKIRDERGMNIIITAHAHVKPVRDPEMLSDYDAFEIKCHEHVSSMWREWVDGLFFVRFKTFIKENDDNQKSRAVGTGERVLYTVKRPAFQAKNRYNLPAELNFTMDIWGELNKYIGKGISADSVKKEISDLLEKITDEKLKATVADTVYKAASNIGQLEAILNRLKQITTSKGA